MAPVFWPTLYVINVCTTKHRIGYIGCIGHIGVQIMLLLDVTQYKVVKGKRLGSVLVKQFSRAQPGWGLDLDSDVSEVSDVSEAVFRRTALRLRIALHYVRRFQA